MTFDLGPALAAWIASAMLAGPTDDEAPGLAMSKAVAVSRVDGLERYVPLEGARLTSEDKLKVYFRPLHFKAERTATGYRARFTEDGRVRRKGEKAALSKEDKLLDYEHRYEASDTQIYLVNTIGLKNLPPGDYEFDIILHDALDPGSSATQTLPFTIIPLPAGAAPAAKGGAPEDAPPPPPKAKARPKGRTKRAEKTGPDG